MLRPPEAIRETANRSVWTHTRRSIRDDTNRGVFKVIGHDTHGARRDLSERRVAKPELLDQEGVVAEQAGGVSCTRERRDRVKLGIVAVRL